MWSGDSMNMIKHNEKFHMRQLFGEEHKLRRVITPSKRFPIIYHCRMCQEYFLKKREGGGNGNKH